MYVGTLPCCKFCILVRRHALNMLLVFIPMAAMSVILPIVHAGTVGTLQHHTAPEQASPVSAGKSTSAASMGPGQKQRAPEQAGQPALLREQCTGSHAAPAH